jgi:hypothetical protein
MIRAMLFLAPRPHMSKQVLAQLAARLDAQIYRQRYLSGNDLDPHRTFMFLLRARPGLRVVAGDDRFVFETSASILAPVLPSL